MDRNSKITVDVNRQESADFLTFIVDIITYGLEKRCIKDIINSQTVSELMKTTAYMKGQVNLDGKMVPLIDVRQLFGRETLAYGDGMCIVIAEFDGMTMGLIVDSVSDEITIQSSNISSVPKTKYKQANRYIKGIANIGDDIILILDCESLMSEGEKMIL